MRWTALLILVSLPGLVMADPPKRPVAIGVGQSFETGRQSHTCLFGCRCGERDNAQTNALLMQILSNQQQIIALLSQQNRGVAPQQTQPPVVINMPGPRGEIAPSVPKGEIPYSPPKGEIPYSPPKGDIPQTPPRGEIPGSAPKGDIPVMPPAAPPSTPGVRETPGGELPSTPPATMYYQQFSLKPYYSPEPAWKPVPKRLK